MHLFDRPAAPSLELVSSAVVTVVVLVVVVEITPIFNYIENTFIDCVGSLNITLAVFQLDVV